MSLAGDGQPWIQDTETFGSGGIDVTTSGSVYLRGQRPYSAGNRRGSAGDSTLANPWLTLDDAYDAELATITYLRAGTYLLTGLPEDSVITHWSSAFSGMTRSHNTLYRISRPTAILDFATAGRSSGGTSCSDTIRDTARFRPVGAAIWVDNLTIRNSFIFAFQMEGGGLDGRTVLRCTIDDDGPGYWVSNAAYVMSRSTGTAEMKYGSYLGENTFTGMKSDNATTEALIDALKFYCE